MRSAWRSPSGCSPRASAIGARRSLHLCHRRRRLPHGGASATRRSRSPGICGSASSSCCGTTTRSRSTAAPSSRPPTISSRASPPCGWDTRARSTATTPTRSPRRSRGRSASERPSLIACRTTIAFGAPTKAGTAAAHGAPLGAAEIAGARAAARLAVRRRSSIPDDVPRAWARGGRARRRRARAPGAQRLDAADAGAARANSSAASSGAAARRAGAAAIAGDQARSSPPRRRRSRRGRPRAWCSTRWRR